MSFNMTNSEWTVYVISVRFSRIHNEVEKMSPLASPYPSVRM
jgi:hypothetical protein